ncbi:hypothetical protein V1511DRAFT_491938 [Dipodascopsis uninucleata]
MQIVRSALGLQFMANYWMRSRLLSRRLSVKKSLYYSSRSNVIKQLHTATVQNANDSRAGRFSRHNDKDDRDTDGNRLWKWIDEVSLMEEDRSEIKNIDRELTYDSSNQEDNIQSEEKELHDLISWASDAFAQVRTPPNEASREILTVLSRIGWRFWTLEEAQKLKLSRTLRFPSVDGAFVFMARVSAYFRASDFYPQFQWTGNTIVVYLTIGNSNSSFEYAIQSNFQMALYINQVHDEVQQHLSIYRLKEGYNFQLESRESVMTLDQEEFDELISDVWMQEEVFRSQLETASKQIDEDIANFESRTLIMVNKLTELQMNTMSQNTARIRDGNSHIMDEIAK